MKKGFWERKFFTILGAKISQLGMVIYMKSLGQKFHYSGNRDIGIINHYIHAIYRASGRKPLAGVFGILLQNGPGRRYVSVVYPPNKQLALNILKEIEKQITGRTLCARDGIKESFEKWNIDDSQS